MNPHPCSSLASMKCKAPSSAHHNIRILWVPPPLARSLRRIAFNSPQHARQAVSSANRQIKQSNATSRRKRRRPSMTRCSSNVSLLFLPLDISFASSPNTQEILVCSSFRLAFQLGRPSLISCFIRLARG